MINELFKLFERRQSFHAAPADTNPATIYTCNSLWATIHSLSICTNGACVVNVAVNRGSDEPLLYNYTIPANSHTTRDFGGVVLLNGETVKVTTDNASDCYFTLTVGEGWSQQ